MVSLSCIRFQVKKAAHAHQHTISEEKCQCVKAERVCHSTKHWINQKKKKLWDNFSIMLNQLGANEPSCQLSREKKNTKVGRKSNAGFCVYAAKKKQ